MYEPNKKNIFGSERDMDIALLEAEAMADELYKKWEKEFAGFRAEPPKPRMKNANLNGLQPPGGPEQTPYPG